MEVGARKKPEGRGTPNQSSKPPKPKSFRRAVYRKSAAAFRWLHIYLSMVGFAAMMFFALTGITLNHPTWLGGSEQTVEDFAGELEIDVLEGEVDRLEIAETLRERHQLKGRVKEFEVDEYECMIVYKSPGYAADAFVDRASGRYGVTVTSSNAIAVMNDLHKGRDSGTAWSLLIDISAILMAAFSVSGFGLLFYLKKRRTSGVVTALIGTILVFLVWAVWVP